MIIIIIMIIMIIIFIIIIIFAHYPFYYDCLMWDMNHDGLCVTH